ncbi:hypothetical protein HCUR_00859 [Holospora curviuscula]|uniref:Uncharacterized protein n=1 Tax=Holospora curviuscula TaxID=1082868 RepID=A0A2S5R8G9_9PROT|nr:hypothetical protein HCUR_00859 [Holospora curviuscula]
MHPKPARSVYCTTKKFKKVLLKAHHLLKKPNASSLLRPESADHYSIDSSAAVISTNSLVILFCLK